MPAKKMAVRPEVAPPAGQNPQRKYVTETETETESAMSDVGGVLDVS